MRFHWCQNLHTTWSTEQTKYKCGMADVVKKKRSRAVIIGYINRILKGEIAAIYDDYKDDNLLALISLQTVIEEKLKNIAMELTDIEKINILVNHVDGEAGNVIKGLLLSNDNYLVTKNMLEDRFGDPQMLISSHMAKLLSLDVVSDIANVKDLRQLYDEVETQVRSLSTLGLDPKSYGAMLTPVLCSKIPDECKLVISRKSGKSLWDINRILEFYNLGLTAGYKVNFENTDTRTTCSVPFTGASILADGSRHIHGKGYKSDSSERPLHSRYGSSYGHKFEKSDVKPGCLFCGQNHFARSCNVVTKPDIRKNILFKEKRRFKCFKIGHTASRCRSEIRCFKCNGNYHSSICTRIRRDTLPAVNNQGYHSADSTALVSICQQNLILLQTARAPVSSMDENITRHLRLLFDSGSQMSYISPTARDELRLQSVGKREVIIKTFGNAVDKKNLDVVTFAVRSRDNFNIYVTALVSVICLPVEEQRINLAKREYSHLRHLPLADNNPNDLPLQIGVLIGADHYWDFIQNTIVRGDSGPVTVSSNLGFILRGSVNIPTNSNLNTNFVSTNLLLIEQAATQSPSSTDVKKVLGFENVNISENDIIFYENFKKTINFENGRYKVELPFKDEQEIPGDNYKVARGRLKSLYRHTKEKLELFLEYGNIIQEQKEMGIIEEENSSDQSIVVGDVYYMPHKPVVRNEKASTKTRIVFDASSGSTNSPVSLNECLFSGPSLTPLLIDVLIRFRAHNYVVIADIEKYRNSTTNY